jgi:hypothetical protein
MNPLDHEYIQRIGELRNSIRDRLHNQEIDKSEIFILNKNDSTQIKNLIKNLISPQIKRRYRETYINVFFDEIFYFYKYLEIINYDLDDIADLINNCIRLCDLAYTFFFEEQLQFPLQYREFKDELFDLGDFSPSINFIIEVLKNCIEKVEILEPDNPTFQFFDELGNLHFQIYLFLENQSQNSNKQNFLVKAFKYYKIAMEMFRNSKQTRFVHCEHLKLFIGFFQEKKLNNIYIFSQKYDILENIYPEFFK